MSHRFRILGDLELVPEGASFAMLLRHAEREALKDGEVGDGCPLTPAGLRDAGELGRLMAGAGIGRVYSSPVQRCVDTAQAILRGAGIDRAAGPVVRKSLGDPMVYVSDPRAAARSFLKYGNAGVVERFVARGGLDGFRPLEHGCRAFVAEVRADLAGRGARNVYVSHDMILIPLISHFTGEMFSAGQWLGYLDGLVIADGGDGLTAIRNGKTHDIRC